jgi:hypothetical protein
MTSIQVYLPFVAATFHVADFLQQERYDRVMSLSVACSSVAHEEEGLHAIYDFIVNSDSSCYENCQVSLCNFSGSCDVIK